MKRRYLVLNPFFLIGLVLLILNDTYLKWEYGNYLTGKLSDFAGLLVFPIFIAFIFPRLKKSISWITAIGFIIWKSPIVTPLINLINANSLISINRVIDHSDYFAMIILVLSHFILNNKQAFKIHIKSQIVNLSRVLIFVTAFFALCATSVMRYEIPQGTVYIGKSYAIKLPKDSVIHTIESMGYECQYFYDSTKMAWNAEYYQIDNVIRYSTDSTLLDTIMNVKFELKELIPNQSVVVDYDTGLTTIETIQQKVKHQVP